MFTVELFFFASGIGFRGADRRRGEKISNLALFSLKIFTFSGNLREKFNFLEGN
jgi:hypothetical protein